MNENLIGKRLKFRKEKRRSNLYRSMLWFSLIVAGALVYRGVQRQEIKPLFSPTPTPTRSYNSYKVEGDTYFNLGKLDCHEGKQDCAIEAYRNATQLEPDNGMLWADLARIQTYSSELLTTAEDKMERRQQALDSIDRAKALEPEDSTIAATRAFVLDWYSQSLEGEDRDKYLLEAEREATRALSLDESNTIALAYYAEVLLDEQKWLQAQQYIQKALERDTDLMDVNRVAGLVSESLGDYKVAIEYFQKASTAAPNLTFLYIRIGNLYRFLGSLYQSQGLKSEGMEYIELALDHYGRAASLNEQLDIKDPNPYLVIANTYAQQGEFFIAVLNVRKALDLDPSTPYVYAQLGLVYRSSKNYEGAIEAFRCALDGCTAEQLCKIHQNSETCDTTIGPMIAIDNPIKLSKETVHYFYSYGSILAALDKPSKPFCEDAVRIFTLIKTQFSDDPDIMSIVSAGEDICAASGTNGLP